MGIVAYVRHNLAEGTQITNYNLMLALLVGAPAHFGFYFLFKYVYHLPYENIYLRGIAVLLCVSVAFRDKLPQRLKAWFPVYWHLGIIFVIATQCDIRTK